MKPFARIAVSVLIGLLASFILTAASFSLLSIVDGTKAGDAIGYGLIVGILGSVFGAIIGLIAGIVNPGAWWGAAIGLLVTAAPVVLYISIFKQPGKTGYYLGESIVILVVAAVPLILTGLITGYFNKQRRKQV